MPTKILVCDDSKTIRVQLQKILSRAGYEVELAENGVQAIQKLNCEPDLLVLDVVMPEMDGYAVCEKLEGLGDRYENLPIIFLTSVKSHAMQLLGRQYGAYLQKPVNGGELLAVVESQLELVSQPQL